MRVWGRGRKADNGDVEDEEDEVCGGAECCRMTFRSKGPSEVQERVLYANAEAAGGDVSRFYVSFRNTSC